jgi:hypothetical protein
MGVHYRHGCLLPASCLRAVVHEVLIGAGVFSGLPAAAGLAKLAAGSGH